MKVEKKWFFKNLSSVFAGGFSRSVFFIIQGFLIARFLGAKSYGLYSLALSYVGLVFGIVDFKIAEAVIKFVAELKNQKEKRKEIYVLSFFFVLLEIVKGVVSFVILVFSGKWASYSLYKNPQLFGLIIALSIYNIVMATNPTLTAFLRLGGHYSAIAWYDFVFGLTSLLIVGGVAFIKRSIWPVVIAYIIMGFLGCIGKMTILFIVFRIRRRFHEIIIAIREWKQIRLPWKKILHFSFILNITSTFRYLTKNLDVLILGKFVSLEGVGVYSLARRISGLFAYFTDPLLIVIYPEMANAWAAKKIGEVKALFKKITVISLSTVSAFYILLGISASWFIPRFFGKDFGRASSVIWFCLPGFVFAVGFFAIYHLMLTMGATREIFFGSLIQVVSMILIFPVLSFYWKEYGAAVAMSAVTVLTHIYYLLSIRKYWRVQQPV